MPRKAVLLKLLLALFKRLHSAAALLNLVQRCIYMWCVEMNQAMRFRRAMPRPSP